MLGAYSTVQLPSRHSAVLPSLRYQKVSEVSSQETWEAVREGSISTEQQRI